jgi:transposase-like protein
MDQAGVVIKKKKKFYTLWEKKNIVDEAYAAPGGIKLTARKYGIQGNQIRRWRNNTIGLGDLPAYPIPRTVEERGVIKAAKTNLTVHKGPAFMMCDDATNHIIQCYEQLRERGIPVSSQLLAIELQRFSPELNEVSVTNLRRRVLRLMKKNNVTHRCVTHKAQNIHFEQPIIVDFTRYINRQIVSGRYSANVIINVDETNVDFDPSPRTTLCRIGTRSVKARISGHSGRCTVVLACTMSGIKLPALVIWRGVPNGRIDREIQGPLYLRDNVRHAVQVKGWLDSDKYQTWIREVLSVYLNGRYGYLLQDQFSVHLKEENVMAAQRAGVEVDFIPAGYTACLQVLDKGVNKPFKQFIQQQSIKWLQSAPQGGKPDRVTITNWVSTSWNQVSVECITNTWRSLQLHPFDE